MMDLQVDKTYKTKKNANQHTLFIFPPIYSLELTQGIGN